MAPKDASPNRKNGRHGRAATTRGSRRRRWLAGGVAVAVVVGAIVTLSLRGGGGNAAQSTAVVVNGPAAPDVGDTAPALSMPTLSGVAFVSPTHRPTLLYFMAGWCGTGVPEAQALARLQPSVGNRVRLVAVDADPTDSWSSLRSFAASVGSPDYDFAKDDGSVSRAFGINSLDITIVVDASGRVVHRSLGALDGAGLRAALAKAGVES